MKRITLLASTLVLNGLLAFSAHAKHIDYDDVFALEYAASPSFFNQERAVLYAHHSMDIMHDRVKQTLWKASLDSDEPIPLLGEIAGLSSWVLSPDDTRLAYVVSKEGKQHLFMSIRNINAMPCQMYLRLVERVLNGYFSEISEVVVIKTGKLTGLWY